VRSLRALGFVVVPLLALSTLVPLSVEATPIVRNPADPAYRVRLHTGTKAVVWTGHERITFTNADPTPLDTIWIRVWSNGVQGCDPLAIDVSNVTGGTAGALSVDCTAMPIDLDAPLDPGDRTSVAMDVRIELPSINDRFGRYGGVSLLGTALPTLAIHDDDGWHLDPFVDLGESFYSIVGEYTVDLTVSRALDTAATGRLKNVTTDGTRETRRYVAQDVRDFEWAAGHLAQLHDRDRDGVRVNVWYRPAIVTRSKANHMLGVALKSMSEFSDDFGAYPYPEVDIVLSAFTTFGGMEYPQLVFSNPVRYTVSHELAHQWWYGIVGDDEYAEPWLDESFATWSQYLPFDPWKNCQPYAWPSADARITNDMAYWSTHPSQYWVIYSQGGCMLANLSHRFGLHHFLDVLADHASAAWLGVARTEDFQQVVADAAAAQLPSFDVDAFWTTWRVGPP
jgi:peptidase M1-like protein